MDALALQLGDGGLTMGAALIVVAIIVSAGIAGGMVGGLLLARKDLGAGLASMMGGFYGPLAAIPAAVVVFVVTVFVL